jgi:glutamyl-tRNA reductase
MQIILVGLSYKTAPLDVREKLAFTADETLVALEKLKTKFTAAEFVLLSTCNRTELYCASSLTMGPHSEDLIQSLAEICSVAIDEFRSYLYIRRNDDAVSHLLTVSSSLDSMVVGEPQIIGQVKESYTLACQAKSTDRILNKLFHCAFAASKMIYSSTSITNRRVSVAGVAVELAKQLLANLSSAKILVIGAGDMGELVVERLVDLGCSCVTLINRTFSRGLHLAEKCNISVAKWEELEQQLAEANIVVTSAATQDYLFTKSSFKKITRNRSTGPLLIIDIAVPRNFDPAINELDNVYLYCIDDLAKVVQKNFKLREGEIDQAIETISQKQHEFMEWFNNRDIGPLLGQMKELFEQISKNEMESFFVGVKHGAGCGLHCKEEAAAMLSKVVNRLLHCVISNVKATAKERGASEAMKVASHIVQEAEQIIDPVNRKENE